MWRIAKEELPFTKFKGQIGLLKINGVKLNPIYSHNKACEQFISAIADSLKQKTHEKIKDTTYLSFMIDGDQTTCFVCIYGCTF